MSLDLLVIGMDGLDSRWVDGHAHPGDLYHIDSYIGDDIGAPHTVQAWPAIYTGRKPETFGITGELTKQSLMTAFDYAQDIPATIFDDVSAVCSLGAFRMAMTLPARPVNGWMIAGFPAGQSADVAPSEFYGVEPPEGYVELRNHDHGPYGNHDPLDYPTRLSAEYQKVEMFCDLIEETDVDVGFFGSQLPDHLGHMYSYKSWGDDDADPPRDFSDSRECALGTNAALGMLATLVERLDPDTFVLVSDHGFGETSCDSLHSVHSTLITDADPEVASILDVRDFITDVLGIEQVTEPYAPTERVELSDAVAERLASWGYL